MKLLITGGAGFIGCNTADYFLARGHDVFLLDNFSRKGSEANLQWLLDRYTDVVPDRLRIGNRDVRDAEWTSKCISAEKPDVVLHLAAQTAVTTSLEDPRTDFEVNAGGTLNVLEAVRRFSADSVVVFASTNKVYGTLPDVVRHPARGWWFDPVLGDMGYDEYGVPESAPLQFVTPYGCSKGTADQYVRDYANTYGLKTIVFRASCVYGMRQNGTEDQGWVAHFARAIARGEPVTVYGDGCQTRDLLWVGDLCEFFRLAIERASEVRGEVFNVGGGVEFAQTVRGVINYFDGLSDKTAPELPGDWRQGDQRCYVTDYRKAMRLLGWKPKVAPSEGLRRLWDWMTQPEIVAARSVPASLQTSTF